MSKIQRNGMKLVSAGAFWRNNEVGGIGIHYPTADNRFVADVEQMLGVWDKFATEEHIMAQLKEMGEYIQKYGDLDNDVALTAFVNIIWLESRGFLQSDEYNGGIWCWNEA